MPNTNDRMLNDFGKYDTMSTEELQQILRDDASKSEGCESDIEMLLYVMDVLAKRRQAGNEGKSPEEALETFKQEYYTETNLSFESESNLASHRNQRITPWMKGLVAATVAITLVIGGTFTASAAGFDIWQIIGKWTKDTFHFGYAGTVTETNVPSSDFLHPCASLQEALESYDISVALVPTWIPTGYSEVDVEIIQTPMHRTFAAKYQSSENAIRIRITDYSESSSIQIERNDSTYEIYHSNGIDYYIFKNDTLLQATWVNDNFECLISGHITISELKGMIDSIEKG